MACFFYFSDFSFAIDRDWETDKIEEKKKKFTYYYDEKYGLFASHYKDFTRHSYNPNFEEEVSYVPKTIKICDITPLENFELTTWEHKHNNETIRLAGFHPLNEVLG